MGHIGENMDGMKRSIKSSLKNFDNSICLPVGHEFVMAAVRTIIRFIFLGAYTSDYLEKCSVLGVRMWRRFTLFFWSFCCSYVFDRVQSESKNFSLVEMICEQKKRFFSSELCCCSSCRHTHALTLFIFYHCRTAVRACNYSRSHMRCQDQTIRLKVFVVEKRKRIESHSHLKMRLQ